MLNSKLFIIKRFYEPENFNFNQPKLKLQSGTTNSDFSNILPSPQPRLEWVTNYNHVLCTGETIRTFGGSMNNVWYKYLIHDNNKKKKKWWYYYWFVGVNVALFLNNDAVRATVKSEFFFDHSVYIAVYRWHSGSRYPTTTFGPNSENMLHTSVSALPTIIVARFGPGGAHTDRTFGRFLLFTQYSLCRIFLP